MMCACVGRSPWRSIGAASWRWPCTATARRRARRFPPRIPTVRPPHPRTDSAAADSLLDAAGWRRGTNGVRERGGHPLAFELLTVGSSRQRRRAAHPIRPRARGRARGDSTARNGIVPRRGARHAANLRCPLHRRTRRSLAVPSLRDVRLALRRRRPRLRRLSRAAPGFASRATRARRPTARARDRWSAVARELDAQAPVAWIYHARGVQGASRRLDGVTMDLRGELVTLATWRVHTDRSAGNRHENSLEFKRISPSGSASRRARSRPLADSLRADMDRVLREAPAISGQKAMLSREGGRCPTDGAPLEFDPYSPHAHRCPTCGNILTWRAA